MQRFAHLLIQRNFLFAAQTDFPCAGIVASLRIHPDAHLAVERGASADPAEAQLDDRVFG